MICETCEQPFAEGAVKIFQGKKVCPGCFQVLKASTVPGDNQPVQIIRTQEIRTTVCPECNAEFHIDTRTCPTCGARIKLLDRAILAFWRMVFLALGAFGLLLFVNQVGAGIENSNLGTILRGTGIGGVCIGLAIFGYRRNQIRKPLATNSVTDDPDRQDDRF